MTQMLDIDRVRRLFDLRGSYLVQLGGAYEDDPYPTWHSLREQAPVHEGVVHEFTGFAGPASFHGLPYPDRPHYSAFSYAACDSVYRDDELFASSPDPIDLTKGPLDALNSMLSMGGTQHRRYRALVQPSFVPAKARWWIENWIDKTVASAHRQLRRRRAGRAQRGFLRRHPRTDHHRKLRRAGRAGPGHPRGAGPARGGRRDHQADCRRPAGGAAGRPDQHPGRIRDKDEDGATHRLSDAEIYSFALLLLAAGSGTTWKQMGITLTALLQRPELLAGGQGRPPAAAGRRSRSRCGGLPTDPMFSRWVTRDVDFYGTRLPEGAVLHICLGAANRDPARWERPDEYDITRALKPSFAFGGGAHVCLGMHVARAEMTVGIGALLDRLPNLRLDPDREPPRIVGFYERGATEIPVVFG